MTRPIVCRESHVERLCERLIHGLSLRQACSDKRMPTLRTVIRWMAENPEVRIAITEARTARAEILADDVVAIADAIDQPGSAAATKIRIEARKWARAQFMTQEQDESANDVADLIERLEEARRRVEHETQRAAAENETRAEGKGACNDGGDSRREGGS
jgi:hypothetical protein